MQLHSFLRFICLSQTFHFSVVAVQFTLHPLRVHLLHSIAFSSLSDRDVQLSSSKLVHGSTHLTCQRAT